MISWFWANEQFKGFFNKKNNHNIPLEKHELAQKIKDDRLKLWKEYIDHDFSQIVFIDETLIRVRKAKQRKWRKIGEKHGISYNKHGKR